MRIPRIYCSETITLNTIVQLSDNAARHVAQVLRLRVNDPLTLFNGDGAEYSAVIQEIQKKKVFAAIKEKLMINRESSIAIHLGVALTRNEKLDLILQKATELGVKQITPLITQYCAVKWQHKLWQQRLPHWQGVIISACEQCERNSLPELHQPIPIADWLSQQHKMGLIFDPSGQTHLKQLKSTEKNISLLIGPEGGFHSNEIDLAIDNNFQVINLGPRILRMETAAITAISLTQGCFGDL